MEEKDVKSTIKEDVSIEDIVRRNIEARRHPNWRKIDALYKITFNDFNQIGEAEDYRYILGLFSAHFGSIATEIYGLQNQVRQSQGKVCVRRLVGGRCLVRDPSDDNAVESCNCFPFAPTGGRNITFWQRQGHPYSLTFQPFADDLNHWHLKNLLHFCDAHGVQARIVEGLGYIPLVEIRSADAESNDPTPTDRGVDNVTV